MYELIFIDSSILGTTRKYSAEAIKSVLKKSAQFLPQSQQAAKHTTICSLAGIEELDGLIR